MTETHPSADQAAEASQRRAKLLGLIGASWTTQVIAVAAELGLADLLAHSASTVAVLAEATATHAPSLRRLLVALATLDLVEQRRDDEFALTPLGVLLRSDANDSLAAWAQFCGGDIWRQWSGLADSVRTGTSARRRAIGSEGFTHLDADRAAADIFNRAMSNLTRSIAMHCATRVDFSAGGHVVDVGGGDGTLLAAVLAAHPHLRGTLFDLQHAIAMAGPALTAQGVTERCELTVGSFFDRVPAGADDYLLKSILHDWDDTSCATILRRCRDGMTARRARLIVIERIAPERFGVTTRDQAIARSDLNMLVCTGGQERNERQFRALLEMAGLHITRITGLPGEFSAIEAEAAAAM